MKKIFTVAAFLFLVLNFSFAQQEGQKPQVSRAVYFDVSPPLRDMVQRQDAAPDNSWKQGIVVNRLNTFSNAGGEQDVPEKDAVRQSRPGSLVSDTTIRNFEGTGNNGFYPPDPDGDVGPSHYFQVVNCRFAVYDKNGNKLLGPSNSSTIFQGLPNNSNDGDAIVLYDENADRWLFSQFSLPNYPNGPFYENVAISQTNDPAGSWYRYQFTFADMPDYPKLSAWRDGYYMTIRRFASGSGNWLGPAAVAMNRTKMLAGEASAEMVLFGLPVTSECPLAADCDSDFPPEGTPCPVAYLTTNSVKVYDFTVDWATPANSTFLQGYSVPVTDFSYYSGNVIPQPGTSTKLDAMSGKRIMFRMPYRTFGSWSSMLLNTTVNAGGVAGIRWMELRNANFDWSLYQEGTYAPADGNHRWMGSIAMDTDGDIALGFSVSGTSLYPSIRYTGRMNGDPPGEMTIAEKGIINGGGSQTTSDGRWGDYSAMTADPAEPGTFWYTQEYLSATSSANWKTRIGSFSFGNIFSATATATPNPLCSGDSTLLDVTVHGGSGTYTYEWSLNGSIFSTAQQVKVAPGAATKYAVTANDGSITRTDTIMVAVMPKPLVNAGADTTLCWYHTSVALHGTASNYSQFAWSTGGTGTFTNATSFETSYLPGQEDKLAGFVDLHLVAGASAPCTGDVTSTKRVTFDACKGIEDHGNAETGLMVQPNPARGTVSIAIRELSPGPAVLSITGSDGTTLFTENIDIISSSISRKMDISGYSKGIYFIRLKTPDRVITEKMVVQ
jgi:hypothetical protein